MSLFKIEIYKTKKGNSPYLDWLDDLDDKTAAIVSNRLLRIRLGNFGDTKRLKDGDGISEIRIDTGPGYRVYFGMQKLTIVILLIGGDKGSQNRDIEKAKRYWAEIREKS